MVFSLFMRIFFAWNPYGTGSCAAVFKEEAAGAGVDRTAHVTDLYDTSTGDFGGVGADILMAVPCGVAVYGVGCRPAP